MKKITLLMSLLITSVGFSQTIPVTFESDIISGAKSDIGVTPADANWFSDSGLASVSVEDLATDTPDKGKAGKIVSSQGGQTYQNAQLLLNNNYIDLTTNKTITLDVYSDNAQDFLLKIEEGLNTVVVTEKGFSHSGSGWETIAVDFSISERDKPVPNDQYRKLVIFPCWNVAAAGWNPSFNSTTYIDNITGVVGDAYVPPAPPLDPTTNALTPPVRDAGDVFSVYSDSYDNVSGSNYNPNWGQSGINNVNVNYNPTGDTSNANTVIAYTNFNYQGIEFQVTDLSDMENLHFDVYSNTIGAKLLVTPINNTTGTGAVDKLVEVELIYNGWSSVNVPTTSFTGMTLDAVYQIKFDGQTGTTPSNIYVDNIYFWKAPTAGVEDFTANSVKMYPNPAKGVVNFTSASNADLDVAVYDLLGKQVMDAQNVQSQLNISSLNPGMYFVKMTQGASSATKKLVVK